MVFVSFLLALFFGVVFGFGLGFRGATGFRTETPMLSTQKRSVPSFFRLRSVCVACKMSHGRGRQPIR